jgi:CDGSH-type Zn-finger protein
MSGWQGEPFAVEVKAGETKAFCMCGLSKNGPFCDGSHVTTDKTPEVVKFEEDQTVYVCGCQQSGNRPYCDGTHKSLSE